MRPSSSSSGRRSRTEPSFVLRAEGGSRGLGFRGFWYFKGLPGASTLGLGFSGCSGPRTEPSQMVEGVKTMGIISVGLLAHHGYSHMLFFGLLGR